MRSVPNNLEIAQFLELKQHNKLDLKPPYQRKSVWSQGERKFFLDTIFNDFPCPPIFLHKTIDESGKITYHVVDGKQRLETVIMFTEDKLAIADNFGDTNLDDKKWSELTTEYKKKFWNYLFSVEYLSEIEETVLSEIFDRFNRNAKKLIPQELRHAKYTGWFISEVEKEAEKQEWKDFGISTTANARRMRDSQFISELFLIIIERKIIGFSQDNIDQKYAEYDDPSETHPNFSESEFTETKEKIKK
jgi:Protein of unknown function DUF262